MKKLVFVAAISAANPIAAEVDGTVFRISCGTLVDMMRGNVEMTTGVRDYFVGVLDATAALNGVIGADKMPLARRKIVSVCDRNRDKGLHRVLKNSITPETF